MSTEWYWNGYWVAPNVYGIPGHDYYQGGPVNSDPNWVPPGPVQADGWPDGHVQKPADSGSGGSVLGSINGAIGSGILNGVGGFHPGGTSPVDLGGAALPGLSNGIGYMAPLSQAIPTTTDDLGTDQQTLLNRSLKMQNGFESHYDPTAVSSFGIASQAVGAAYTTALGSEIGNAINAFFGDALPAWMTSMGIDKFITSKGSELLSKLLNGSPGSAGSRGAAGVDVMGGDRAYSSPVQTIHSNDTTKIILSLAAVSLAVVLYRRYAK